MINSPQIVQAYLIDITFNTDLTLFLFAFWIFSNSWVLSQIILFMFAPSAKLNWDQ
jgi:hypothetical protein